VSRLVALSIAASLAITIANTHYYRHFRFPPF
jgi:hypothetical protein